jgi:hypothetical protein
LPGLCSPPIPYVNKFWRLRNGINNLMKVEL